MYTITVKSNAFHLMKGFSFSFRSYLNDIIYLGNMAASLQSTLLMQYNE